MNISDSYKMLRKVKYNKEKKMKSETEIREMLEKLKAMYNEVPFKDKYIFSPILIQINMLEYVLEIGTEDLCDT